MEYFFILFLFISLFCIAFKIITPRHHQAGKTTAWSVWPPPNRLFASAQRTPSPLDGGVGQTPRSTHDSQTRFCTHSRSFFLGNCQEIFQKHNEIFSDRLVLDVVASPPNYFEDTLSFIPGGRSWRNRRHICNTKLFAAHRLGSLQHLRHEKAQDLVSYIKKCCASGVAVDIARVAFATILKLMSNSLISTDMVDYEFESANEFKDLILRILEGAGKPNLSDCFPMLRMFDLQGVRRHIVPAVTRLHEILDKVINKRVEDRKLMEKSARNADFLNVLLDHCDEDGSGFSRQSIKALILLIMAGSDTSAVITEWAMTELLKNPEVMQKARQEIVQNVGTQQLIQESNIDKLPYLQALVKETMRLHPPAPLLLPYKAKNNVELFGFTIPKNTQLLVNAWAIGRDPNYWESPLSFTPERFLNSCNNNNININNMGYRSRDFEFLPFGAGRRICPGVPLAVRMVHLTLGSMIQCCKWRLPEGVEVEKMDCREQFGVTLKKAVPLLAAPFID